MPRLASAQASKATGKFGLSPIKLHMFRWVSCHVFAIQNQPHQQTPYRQYFAMYVHSSPGVAHRATLGVSLRVRLPGTRPTRFNSSSKRFANFLVSEWKNLGSPNSNSAFRFEELQAKRQLLACRFRFP